MGDPVGCTLVRRGLLEHYKALGASGIGIYLWLLLRMDPMTRTLHTTVGEIAADCGTGRHQVLSVLRYLEARKYVLLQAKPGAGLDIEVLKADCPTAGARCPFDESAPCIALSTTLSAARERRSKPR